MLTMGMDFWYSQAQTNFANMDRLIEATNRFLADGSLVATDVLGQRFENVNIFYSTPERYTRCKYADAVHANEGKDSVLLGSQAKYDAAAWQESAKTGDFFPYADCEHCYWAGYFSSRQGLKRLERAGSSFLHAARQVESMSKLQSLQTATNEVKGNDGVSVAARESSWTSSPLYSLDDAMGVAQHHDCVTGTSKQHVAYDYAQRIAKGVNDAGIYMSDSLRGLLFGPQSDMLENLSHCNLLNETICTISQVSLRQLVHP